MPENQTKNGRVPKGGGDKEGTKGGDKGGTKGGTKGGDGEGGEEQVQEGQQLSPIELQSLEVITMECCNILM